MENTWDWKGYRFQRTAGLVKTADDEYPASRYANKNGLPLLADGGGPFCRFRVDGLKREAGVYALFVDGALQYIGRTQNFKTRIYDYGQISPRKCYKNGQSRNLDTNKRIREAFLAGQKIDLFFYLTPDYKAIESVMIEALRPPWNKQGLKKIGVE